MAENSYELYEAVDHPTEGVYTAPLSTSNEVENEYQEPQLNKGSRQQPLSSESEKNKDDTKSKHRLGKTESVIDILIGTKKCVLIVAGVSLLLLFALTLVALIIGGISLQSSQTALNTPSDEPKTNIPEMLTEMNDKLNQLIAEVKGNNTMLRDQITELNASSFDEIVALGESIRSELNESQANIAAELSTIWTQLNTTNETSLYQNCYQDVRSCEINRTTDSLRQLYCDTEYLRVNTTDYYTVDMRCEYSGLASLLEAPSLQRSSQSSNDIMCQCSVIVPTANGLAVVTPHTPPAVCTVIITRCR